MNSNEILTDEEMSALLPDSEKNESGANERDRRPRITLYNFRHPDRLSKEQIRSLYLLHDLFAHGLSSSLPLFLRAASEVHLISVEQQSYGEYLKGLSDPNVLFTVTMQPLHGVAAIEISPAIAFPLIDRMLGGKGDNLTEERPATEIEQKVLEGYLSLVIDSFRDAWRPIIELDMQVVACETRPQLLQIVAPNEVVVNVSLFVQIGEETKGKMSFCLPIIVLEPIIERFLQSTYSRTRETLPEQAHELLNSLSLVRFPVSAQLNPAQALVSDLLSLSEGDVIRTSHRIDKPVSIEIGGNDRFVGNLASVGGQVFTRITDQAENTKTEPLLIEELEESENFN